MRVTAGEIQQAQRWTLACEKLGLDPATPAHTPLDLDRDLAADLGLWPYCSREPEPVLEDL